LLVKRRDWDRIQEQLQSLTPERIHAAITAISNHQVITDSAVNTLLKHLRSIGSHQAYSFGDKLVRRAEMKGFLIRNAMAAVWLTINPSDLRNPLVLHLAGISFKSDSMSAAAAAVRSIAITANPIAVAQFFHYVCDAFFKNLLQSDSGDLGILGDVSAHYGMVESNGRGMLHLHCLVWLRGNFTFDELRNRVLCDVDFAQRLITFLETIITCAVNDVQHDDNILFDPVPSFSQNLSDDDFFQQLLTDSQSIANKTQRHSTRHNATCFKMPRTLYPTSSIDQDGVVHLQRTDGWITSYNPAIASCLRSNHDITWIPTSIKALAYIYYLTNYMTKADTSPQQILVKAALLSDSMKQIAGRSQPTENTGFLQDSKFLLRLYNALAHDQEISGVQIASDLLQLPSYYTNTVKFVHINLWSLRQCLRSLLQPLSESAIVDEIMCFTCSKSCCEFF
jgi:hypothetical protein